MRRGIGRRRVLGGAASAIALIGALAVGPRPAAGQVGLGITTPYPAVSVQAGASVSFDLTLSAAEPVRVDLAVEGLPDGWTASFSGGGNEIQGAYVNPGTATDVSLTVQVPEEAAVEPVTLTVVGRGGGETARLELDLVPAQEAGGTVSIQSDYPSLRGSTDTEFQFNMTLNNNTPQQLTFSLSATGPSGWEVNVQPGGEARAASVTVDARGTQRLELTATPPQQAEAGAYPISVQAVAGEHQAAVELAVEITGRVQMSLRAADERLNTTANAGSTRDFEVVLVNEGTSPLTGVQLSGSGPREWEVAFEPATIELVPPGESATATARITPSGNAVAGDYVVTLDASTEGADESIEVRVTVETPPIWGLVGVALILATLGGMVLVFRRYGRR